LEAEELKRREEIRQELAKQAAAHNNHLAQMLKLQHEELAAFYESKLTAENQRIRGEFFSRVADTLGKINGIENAMKVRFE
jgi:mitofilin